MKFNRTQKLSLILAFGLAPQALQALHPSEAATVAGLAALPLGIKFAADQAGNINPVHLFGDKTGLEPKKVGTSVATAAGVSVIATMRKNGGRLPELSSAQGKDALLRGGVAATLNQIYLSQTVQSTLRSLPGGHYLACECKGICHKCWKNKEAMMILIDTGVNFVKFPTKVTK